MENLSMMNFNIFDITIATLILLLGIKGFLHGFIKEIFGVTGLIGGVYFASRLSSVAAEFIGENFLHLENTALLKLIGFIAVLLVIWLSVTIVGSIFSKLTSASGLGFVNRIFGFIAGGAKYFLIFALIFTALSNISLFKKNFEKYVKDSILYPHLKNVGSYVINLDPTTLGLESTSTTQIVKNIVNINDSNITKKSTISE